MFNRSRRVSPSASQTSRQNMKLEPKVVCDGHNAVSHGEAVQATQATRPVCMPVILPALGLALPACRSNSKYGLPETRLAALYLQGPTVSTLPDRTWWRAFGAFRSKNRTFSLEAPPSAKIFSGLRILSSMWRHRSQQSRRRRSPRRKKPRKAKPAHRWLTPPDLADILGVEPPKVMAWIKQAAPSIRYHSERERGPATESHRKISRASGGCTRQAPRRRFHGLEQSPRSMMSSGCCLLSLRSVTERRHLSLVPDE